MAKAYVKTLEVMVAIIVTAIFVVILVPTQDISQEKEEKFTIIERLVKEPGFRSSIINTADNCYNKSSSNSLTNIIDDYVLEDYIYYICLDKKKTNLPEKKIFVESAFITGNITDYNHKVVRLYYWVP